MKVKLVCLVIGLLIGLFCALAVGVQYNKRSYHRSEAMWLLYLVEMAERERRMQKYRFYFFIAIIGFSLCVMVGFILILAGQMSY